MTIRSNHGALLLEALLGVVILSVSITVVISAMTQAARALTHSREMTLAALTMDSLSSQLRLSPSADLSHNLNNPLYEFSVERERAQGWDEVDMRLSWNRGGKNYALTVSTYVPTPNPNQ